MVSEIILGKMACLSYNWLPNVASLYKQNLSMILRCGLFFKYNTCILSSIGPHVNVVI